MIEKTDEEFERVYRQYYSAIWRHIRGMRFAEDDAHDIAQETFKRIFERDLDYRGIAIWPLLQVIAKNIILNRIRDSKAKKRDADIESVEQLPPGTDVLRSIFTGEDAPSRESTLINEELEKERALRLAAAIQALSPGARQCFLLWIDGFKYDEIARELGVSVDAVKSRLRDARRGIRSHLDASA